MRWPVQHREEEAVPGGHALLHQQQPGHELASYCFNWHEEYVTNGDVAYVYVTDQYS